MALPSALYAAFPGLRTSAHAQTSQIDPHYNCIAWAAGESHCWWWPLPQPFKPWYWPPGAPRQASVPAFEAAYGTRGFEVCADGTLEPGFEKIAIYATAGVVKHAARQRPSGAWTSKLGEHVDIEHTLEGLEGATYGHVARFLRRRLPA